MIRTQVASQGSPSIATTAADTSSILHRLRSLGAAFDTAALSGDVLYARNWLREAYRLDPRGPIGDRAFLDLLARGFDTSPSCAEGPEAFRRVIEEGEAFLLRVDAEPEGGRDPRILAEVHYRIAEAQRDIVALASGHSSYADPETYSAEAEAARASAVEHYRAALTLDPHAPGATAAWSEAWRLSAGLPPAGLAFYCIYD